MHTELSPRFFERYASIIPDFDEFLKFTKLPLKQTFRINTLKAQKDEVLAFLSDINLEAVPWYDLAFRINEKVNFGQRVEHFLGLIYVQELASMIPALVLDPKPNETILDMSAAPGSKTTQIASIMANTGLIVANDISSKRINKLIFNIEHQGVLNTVIIRQSGQRLGHLFPEYFDRVILDAPCSLEGMVRKSWSAVSYWSETNIIRHSKIQKGLINSAFQCLKPKGTLVYSTCTYAPEENEMVVDYLLKKYSSAVCEPIAIDGLKTRPGILEWQGQKFDKSIQNTIRLFPQDNDTEGFFIAKIRKL
ncbi:MAG: RsmB/NOP family class I SAM-dependent RNA methyltransferase [candidate division WOR-3 bacterium]|nr:RsmB/NOP family class I SAM-dependent RNA methyltransferase [candidate division WOR-3 bacterium]